ncbi:MAG: hypothetical protein KF691_04735 [Phycisphaeraceae bacterium]|nr:hypothetical protein [Phycisphaeraceae bacterium]
MRIHWNKVYRAFPELDRFDDRQCVDFIRFASEKFWVSRVFYTIVGVAFCITLLIALLVGENFLLRSVLFPNRAVQIRSNSFDVWHAMAVGVCVFATLLCGLYIRDRWLRWAVSTQIVAARCLNCQYSLLGLIVENGEVLCPECGHRTDLAAQGLKAEELLA